MGYAVYRVGNRDAGYGVPSICDHPGCDKRIDRGLSYICGGEPASDSRGCNLYFCAEHMRWSPRYGQLCGRCWPRQRKPFDPKPDVDEWVLHKLIDGSWGAWRASNPDAVDRLRTVAREILAKSENEWRHSE